ncbi:MAG: YebC/PmpR family DNA-binding transcriptional regulator [Caldilineaceae bacterium]|nr:YebC/PmpR family DNA-binding transcriptional regulator [Caldilineaceae bacterium]
MEEITYEVWPKNGITMLVECLTDNRNRTIFGCAALFFTPMAAG